MQTFFHKLADFFKNLELWQKVAATLIAAIIIGIAALTWRIFIHKSKSDQPSKTTRITTGPNSTSQVAVGDDITQQIKVDKGINITVESGATANITIIDYQDGIAKSTIPKVKELFEAARAHYAKKEFDSAIEKLKNCLDLETDHEKRGALNLQIGNCHYEQQHYIKAAEFYSAALREARQANDHEGEASALVSLANTYLFRPSSDSRIRAENVRKAVQYYSEALTTFTKDEYPVQYATTQNNLGTAYTDLPAATPEERANNVKKAIDCYRAALEIYKKDEYPQNYCFIAANMGMILEGFDNEKACYWLKEAYELRQFLPGQGKEIEDVMNRVCD